MINYDLSNKTPLTIEALTAVGFTCNDEGGFTVCSWRPLEKNNLIAYFTNGQLEGISMWGYFELSREDNQFEVLDTKLDKVTVETLLWLIDVFLSEE